jgi:hypothetical protein
MKSLPSPHRLALALAALLAPALPAQVVTFTTNVVIGINDTNYDGLELVVTNCALTVDGPHSFASLLVQPGGVLTHSYAPSGSLENRVSITAEPHVLSGTDPAPLNQAGGEVASVVVTDDQGLLTYVLNTDYALGTDTNGFVTIQRTLASAIPDSATVLVDYDLVLAPVASGLRLTIAGDVTVENGGAIQASQRGYGPGRGPGRGGPAGSPPSGSGGGHGGYGGTSAANAPGGAAYGSTEYPTDKGSGGGNGWAPAGGIGGGAVRLTVGGALRVNGAIMADAGPATYARAGGGAGGSIRLSAQSFSGSGAISASGGAGDPPHGGGGGGGHIAVICSTNTFAGSLMAYGGAGAQRGGAGTIFTQITGQPARLLMDNGGFVGASSLLAASSQPSVTSTGGAILLPDSTLGHYPLRSLLITSNAWLVAPAYPATMAVYLSVYGDATVESGGAILADGAGYLSGAGTGFGRTYSTQPNTCGGGGGYGGPGGAGANPTAAGGATYGSMSDPHDPGSGGGGVAPLWPGGPGGGGIQLIVTGTLTVNGRISANGGTPSIGGAGGGSGGSVLLTCGALAGAGSITANGGDGDASVGGGGGGGRIAVNYSTNLFSGTITAQGGRGFNNGGAGTSYFQQAGSGPAVVLDNGGQTGPSTPLGQTSFSQLRIGPGVSSYVSSGSTLTLDTLQIETNAWLVVSNNNLTLTVNSNATIAAGGGITADSTGYPGGQGPSYGSYYYTGSNYIGGGGGYGGLGGSGAHPNARGGTYSYGVLTGPVDRGSGGGGYIGSPAPGGAGGGAIRLTVNGTLALDGRISADGGSVVGSGAGGGSGGSVWLTVGNLSGAGVISANGGSTDVRWGGGGGGGRVSVTYTSNLFTGPIMARGGIGYQGGGAGTVYFKANGDYYGGVCLNNGGVIGVPTPLNLSSSVDISLSEGASLLASGSLYPRNLVIASNAWLLSPSSLVVQGDVTIHPGGAISADGVGFAAGQGQGAGRYYTFSSITYAGGGAHGGYGAVGGHLQAFGGMPYDTVTSPMLGGSGGGSSSTSPGGGAGGGVIRLTVNGALVVNGRITAAGLPASGMGGGGAGGTIMLSAGTLSGSGTIAADGGNGHPLYGGGGGGGRIAITGYASNLFTGTLSAWGGGGLNRGGAGTIYSKGVSEPYGLVVLDNGGPAGTNTGFAASGPLDLVMRGGARWALTGSQTVRNLGVEAGAALLIPNATLTVSGSATINAGGQITADRLGNIGGQGPGAGRTYGYGANTSGGGGGYGGFGGMGTNVQASAGLPYGVVPQPNDLGSGGGGTAVGSYPMGGAGGGSARLNVTGLLRVDGALSANGGNATGPGGGGGSGGSLNITVGSLAGSGVISASGGAGDPIVGGGGGGGRIAITAMNPQTTNQFAGTISAGGGTGFNPGGAGTLFMRLAPDPASRLIVDGGGASGPATRLMSLPVCDLVLQGRGHASLSGPLTLLSLLVASNSSLVLTTAQLTISGNATVESGASLLADGSGYAAGQGPTPGRSWSSGSTYAGGGGHGGYGGAGGIYQASGGLSSGSISQPNTGGSGGASFTSGGAGGGAVQMTVNGTCRLDGAISANGLGAAGLGGGGGAGGSIRLTAGQLTGAGRISANGGSGDAPLGGGGGGGRIAVYCGTNDFTGPITSYGGSGANRGGAGTIWLACSNQPPAQLVLDNGGWPGADTPFSSLGEAALSVGGGARAVPVLTDDFVPSLRIAADGVLTTSNGMGVLKLAVLGDAVIASGGSVAMDGRGHAQMVGPGAGQTVANLGSGAGYGGAGGATLTADGGVTYGSAERPVDPGSGGGLGWGPLAGGSEGGGAIRLTVGGTLTVDGRITADGNDGWQDNAGGGSGGSVWVEAGALAGAGAISADGGMGELFYGGGGGGGRIAIYQRTNGFTGSLSALGGEGAAWGEDGSLLLSTNLSAAIALSHSPMGTLTWAVDAVAVQFDGPISPASISAADFILNTPVGPLEASNVTIQVLSSGRVQFNFPPQNTPGDYQITVGPDIENLFGQPMLAAYTGQFTLAQPVISGVITNLDGTPAPGVTLQPDGGLPAVVTGADGAYALPVLPGWTGTVTPLLAGFAFVPGTRTFTQLNASLADADWLMVETISPTVTLRLTGANLLMTWPGIPGVTYSPLWSTNLVQWEELGVSLPGTNGPMQMVIPLGTDPQSYFRLRAQN